MDKIVVIDIEAESTGYEVGVDLKRIISVQLYDGSNVEFFYDDSSTNNVKVVAKERIKSLVNEGAQFVGYSITIFDIILIKKFLDIEIPPSQVIEITEMEPMVSLMKELNVRAISLEKACLHFGVRCEHKRVFDPIAHKIQQNPKVIKKAINGAKKMTRETGWSIELCQRRALEILSHGMAILEKYNEFVKSNGNVESTFYKYAVGDVITEFELYNKLKSIT